MTPRPLYEVLPDGRWDFYIDNSTLKDFRCCEQYFNYRHILQKAPKGPVAYVINLGSWWSSTMEDIYSKIQDHRSISLVECLDIGAAQWAKLKMEDYKNDKRYSKFGGMHGAIVIIEQYYQRHIIQDMTQWRVIAVESGFGLKGECLVGENDKVVVHWVGKPDLTVLAEHRLTPLDHKMRARIDSDIHSYYKPNTQLAGYAFATQGIARSLGLDVTVDRVIVNVCARTDPKEENGKAKPRFVRTTPGFNPTEIAEWQVQTLKKVTRLREAIEKDDYLWNENVCNNIYYRPCPYRMLCSSPPGARADVMRGNYVDIERWIPYQVEDEE